MSTPPKVVNDYLNEYANALGRLMGNLASLELALRLALYTHDPAERWIPGGNVTTLTPGQQVPENWLTSWHTLGELIKAYNKLGGRSKVPVDIKDVRDAFAHGRILTEAGQTSTLRLIRFSKPRDGVVTVEENWTLTIDFMREQSRKALEAMKSVGTALPQAASTDEGL
jgi:hypothetical protein